jgi:cytochrome P450
MFLVWEGRSPVGTANLISIRDRNEHSRRRKPWTRGLNTESLREYEPTLRRRVSQLVERLADHVGKADVDLAQWFNFFT